MMSRLRQWMLTASNQATGCAVTIKGFYTSLWNFKALQLQSMVFGMLPFRDGQGAVKEPFWALVMPDDVPLRPP